jgi:DNA-binding transcriptional ArsR family regulator
MVKQMLDLDRVFHALADPTRRAIVERLTQKPRSVSDLAEPLDMTLAAVVQHLAVLEDSGLVKTEKVGRVRTCQLEQAVLGAAEDWISKRRTQWEKNLDRLGEVIAQRRKS